VRLPRVRDSHKLGKRILFGIIRAVSGFRVPDVVRTLWYREDFFGKHQNALTQQVMRGPSELTVGERELIAAYVSQLGQCVF
jgi:alkylhydroperoxidase family enzyme